MSKTKSQILNGVEGVVSSKIVDNNTAKITLSDGSVAYRLHATNVVTQKPDGSIILDSGGWRTPTTKNRINKYSPIRLSQSSGIWYANGYPFYDGMIFSGDGKLLSKEMKANVKKVESLKAKIKKFCARLTTQNLPWPSRGDCFDCSLRTQDGRPMGDISHSDHLLNHLKEGYLHGSLIVNAMRDAGFKEDQIALYFHHPIIEVMRRALKKYLQKKLIPQISVK